MPKIRRKSTQQHSKLIPYLRNKCKVIPKELHELPIISPESIESITTYPASWADPVTLSKTDAYQITRNYKLPNELEELASKNSYQDIRVYSNKDEKLVAMVTPTGTSIYFYKDGAKNRFINLSTDSLSVDGNTPFFNTFIYSSNKIGAMAVSTKGEVYYWAECTVDTWLHYQIPLLSQHEQITVVHTINKNRTLLGSSTGEIYFLRIDGAVITASTFYNHTGVASYISGIFLRKPLPRVSDVTKPNTAESILNINTIGNDAYFVSSKYIALWHIQPQHAVKLISRIHVEAEVTASVAQHIPSNVSKEYIRSEILDMNVITKEEMVVLASYSVPDMGEYVQYAIVTFSLQSEKDNENVENNMTLYVKHTTSIPYSAIPVTLKTSPRLAITDALAFVSFDQTVIAVSLDRKSVFEESVVLQNRDDYVLYTEVRGTEENEKKIDTAVIYTLKSGILDFRVDTDKIQESRATGNMYASVVDDVLERDTIVFKSKLEQAVFFGAADKSPLQFPLRVEQEDVSKAVTDLANDIMNKKCELLPSDMDTDIYLESRYTFEKRIMNVLQDNDLGNMLSEDDRSTLFKLAEYYYLSIVLWELYKENFNDLLTQNYWATKMILITELQLEDQAQVEGFLNNNVFSIVDFVNKVQAGVLEQVMDQEDHIKLLCSTNEILLRTTGKARLFEQKYISVYGLERATNETVSVQLRDMIFGLFQANIEYFKKIAPNNNVKESENLAQMKEKVGDLATLLLDTLYEGAISDKMNSGDDDIVYQSIRKPVIEGLCLVGLYEKAIDLAERHNDIPAVVASVQGGQLSPEIIEEKNIHFINLFKTEYFDYLLKYLDKKNQSDAILDLCSLYPNHADPFFARYELDISWIYYLRQKNYDKSLASLKIYLDKELTVGKRREILVWTKMIYVNSSNYNNPESLELKKISADLDFEDKQMSIIEMFQNHLQFFKEDGLENKAAFIFSRCASVLYNSGRTAEIQEMTSSLTMLLDGVSIEKKQVIKLLVMLDNVGSDIENIYTAIDLVHQSRIGGYDKWKQHLSIIWKEVYIRDLNGRYLQNLNNDDYTDIQKGVALQETHLFRVMMLCKIKKVPADEIFSPGSLILTEIDEDKNLNQQIVTPELRTFFMNILATIDGKKQLTYVELENSLKRNTM